MLRLSASEKMAVGVNKEGKAPDKLYTIVTRDKANEICTSKVFKEQDGRILTLMADRVRVGKEVVSEKRRGSNVVLLEVDAKEFQQATGQKIYTDGVRWMTFEIPRGYIRSCLLVTRKRKEPVNKSSLKESRLKQRSLEVSAITKENI